MLAAVVSKQGVNASAAIDGLLLPWTNFDRVDALIDGSEWIPTFPYLRHGNKGLWYLRALYFAVCNLTGLGKSPVHTPARSQRGAQ